jgi:hypothetical protein
MKNLFGLLKDKQTGKVEGSSNISTTPDTVKLAANQAKTEEGKNKKTRDKPKRKIKKICKYCLSQFAATRIDAKYCSDSCRQSVYEKGGDVNKYQNPSEHFFLDILEEMLGEILDNEYQRIHIETLYKWRAYLDVGRHLYNKYMDQNSQFTKIYFNEVVPAFKDIENLFRMSNSNYTIYNVKPEFRERWQWVVDTLSSK